MVLVPSFPCVPEVTFGISGAAVVFLLAIMPPLPLSGNLRSVEPSCRRHATGRPAMGRGWLVGTNLSVPGFPLFAAGRARPSLRWSGAAWWCDLSAPGAPLLATGRAWERRALMARLTVMVAFWHG